MRSKGELIEAHDAIDALIRSAKGEPQTEVKSMLKQVRATLRWVLRSETTGSQAVDRIVGMAMARRRVQ